MYPFSTEDLVGDLAQCRGHCLDLHTCLQSLTDPPREAGAFFKDISNLVVDLQEIEHALKFDQRARIDNENCDISKVSKLDTDLVHGQVRLLGKNLKHTLAALLVSVRNAIAEGQESGAIEELARERGSLPWARGNPTIQKARKEFQSIHLDFRSSLMLANKKLSAISTESLFQTAKYDINAVDICIDINSRTALYWAVRRANLSVLRELLQHGASVSTGKDPIAWSCREDFDTSECLELLLTNKASPNGCDSDGYTPLHVCGITGRNEDFIKPLLKAGADINRPYSGDHSAYHGVTALGFACLYANYTTSRILLTYGANPNFLDHRGRSALHLATLRNQLGVLGFKGSIIKTLLNAGADLEYRDMDGVTVLGFACLYNNNSALETLLAYGADPNFLDYKGRSALHLTILRNQQGVLGSEGSIMKTLLEAGVRLEHRDQDGFSAANIAMLRQDFESLEILMDVGANITYPMQPLYRENGYCMLAWPIQNHWHSIVLFLLRRPEVNVYDLHPTSGDSILHLLANNLDSHTLVIFEEAVDLRGFASKPIDALDSIGRVGFEDESEHSISMTAFRDLIRRVKAANVLSEDINTTLPTEPNQDVLNSQQSMQNRDHGHDINHQETLSKGRLEVLPSRPTPLLTGLILAGNMESDESNPDSKAALMHWHSKKSGHARKRKSGFRDSSYASLESDGKTGANAFPNMKLATRRQRSRDSLESIKSLYSIGVEVKPPKGSANQVKQRMINANFPLILSLPMLAWKLAAKAKKLCKSSLRPRIASTCIRLTWNCPRNVALSCMATPGEDLDAVAELADALGATSIAPSSSTNNVPLPSMPSQIYQGTNSDPHRRDIAQQIPAGAQVTSGSSVNSQVSTPTPTSLFFELCINTGTYWQSLGEIDITHVENDMSLGRKIRQRYNEVRGFRIKKHFLLKPVDIRYVSFGLENRYKVHILENNSVPTSTDPYQWEPCPPKHPPPYGPVPRSVVLHWLKNCKANSNDNTSKPIWLERLPKKVDGSLTQCSDDLPTAWGLRIIEGADRAWILWTMICVLAICLGPIVAYVVLTKDIQGATGIGGMTTAVLTLMWTLMKVEEWKDE